MSGTPRVVTVIVNWNKAEATAACLRSLADSSLESRPLVVDNGSSDGSEAALRRDFPSLTLLQTGSNLGYAAGANRGMRAALRGGCDYLWLLNNDALADRDALRRLVEAAESRPEAAFVGSAIFDAQDRERIWSLGGVIDRRRGFATEHVGWQQRGLALGEDLRSVDYAPCCSLLVRSAALERIGLLSEAYFMYFEDADWCLRASRLGFSTLICPSSRVWHDWDRDAKEHSSGYVGHLTRHRLWLCRQWEPRRLLATLWRCGMVAGGIALRSRQRRGLGAAQLRILAEFLGGLASGLLAPLPAPGGPPAGLQEKGREAEEQAGGRRRPRP